MLLARFYFLLLIVFFSYPASLLAQAPAETPSMEKYAWLTKIKAELSQNLCADKQYFMHCFDIDKPTCLELSDYYLTACIDNLSTKIPTKLSQKDAQYWGPLLIFCSHDLYSHFMADKKKNLPECEQQSTVQTK